MSVCAIVTVVGLLFTAFFSALKWDIRKKNWCQSGDETERKCWLVPNINLLQHLAILGCFMSSLDRYIDNFTFFFYSYLPLLAVRAITQTVDVLMTSQPSPSSRVLPRHDCVFLLMWKKLTFAVWCKRRWDMDSFLKPLHFHTTPVKDGFSIHTGILKNQFETFFFPLLSLWKLDETFSRFHTLTLI